MKTTKLLSILFAIILFPRVLNATVYTVNNIPTSTIAQFSSIQSAINACASTGDTVLVHGSPNTYSGFNILNKSIVVIGPGWAPDKNPTFVAQINGGINISGVASLNSEIQGLFINSGISVGDGNAVPSGLRFVRNYFFNNDLGLNNANNMTFSNYVVEGNVFSQGKINGLTSCVYLNFVIQNNYFKHSVFNFTSFSNPSSTILIDHNLFFGPGSGTEDVFSNCAHLLITNNIFVRRNAGSNNSFSTFSNNITYHPATAAGASYDTPWLVNSNLNGAGNLANQDPQMTAQTSVNSGTNNPLLDFTITAGPANNSGSDGKDLGLLYDSSGSLNWANSRNSRLPRIYNFVITNPTTPAGGSINIQVEGRKSN